MRKNREVAHLEHFKESYPSFPDGKIEKSESPDFIVHTPQKQLGIEHTEIFQPGLPNGESLQAQDSLAQKAVQKANEIYSKTSSQPLLVQILFKPRSKMRPQDIQHIAENIVHTIEFTPIDPNAVMTLKRTRENAPFFPAEVAMIHILYQPNGNENRWFCSSAGFISQLTPEHIQERIDSKEKKASVYKTKCPEIWLLIVADDLRIPSTVDLTESAVKNRYSTTFDKVFFFWNSSRRYIELKTEIRL